MQQLALSPSQRDRPSHGLRSLWGMLDLNAAAFVGAATHLEWLRSQIHAGASSNEWKPNAPITDELRQLFIDKLTELKMELVKLETDAAIASVDRATNWLHQGHYATTYADVGEQLKDIRSRMLDQLEGRKVFALSTAEVAYFDFEGTSFGLDFPTRFQPAVFEADEAAKCIALGRSTAAVFHLMRVMEYGIRAAARCLQIPDPLKPAERNWGSILKAIDDKIKSTTFTQPNDKPFFQGAYGSLTAVKDAWRNPTMHVEHKYQDSEAQYVLAMVRGFMQKISSRFDEDGKPFA